MSEPDTRDPTYLYDNRDNFQWKGHNLLQVILLYILIGGVGWLLGGCGDVAQIAGAVGQGLNSPSWDNTAVSNGWDNAAQDALPRAPICDVDPNCDQCPGC